MEFICTSLEMTQSAAKKVARYLTGPRVVAFTGAMGAGKTTFISFLCKELGYDGRVTSPTFALMNEYLGNLPIYHYDMYRISGYDDLYGIGFFDFIDSGLSLIEWSENIKGLLPDDTVYIDIKLKGDTRIITVSENIKC